jgi:hypothetical protein
MFRCGFCAIAERFKSPWSLAERNALDGLRPYKKEDSSSDGGSFPGIRLDLAASAIVGGCIGGFKGIPDMLIYGSTEAAIRSLVRGWILDLKAGVRSMFWFPLNIDT